VRKPVKGSVVKVFPAYGNGITINGIPVSIEKIIHNLFRIDMQYGDRYAYICEHPLASLKMHGIHDAAILGIRKRWDFARPEDRSAYVLGLGPDAVVGPPDGTISGGLVEAIEKVGVKNTDIRKEETTVEEKVEVSSPHGKILIEPAKIGEGLNIRLKLGPLDPIEAILDPYEGLEPRLRSKVAKSVTPFLVGFTEDSAFHTLGDLIGDIAGSGGIDNAYVRAEVFGSIHMLTINACKKARICKAEE
jgi:hypothetical protein